MANLVYGIIAEGEYDTGVYEELVRRVKLADVIVVTRPAGGVTRLLRLFPSMLGDLEHVVNGAPVDKALVVRDSDGRDCATLERAIQDRIRDRHYSFPRGVQIHAVHRAMETWLLADEAAINRVALSRGGKEVPQVHEILEDIENPKEKLGRLLSSADLPYDAGVCREIAHHARIETLKYRCPSFRSFEQKVIDC